MTKYYEFIKGTINNTAVGVPIYTDDLTNALAKNFQLTNNEAQTIVKDCIAKILQYDETDLRIYKEGILYRTVKTSLGEFGIKKMCVLYDKYIKDGNGYESGAYVLNRMGLTTWLCRDRVIVTNIVSKETRDDEFRNFIFYPAKTLITKENRNYLQVLDVLEMFEDNPIDCINPYNILLNHIETQGLDKEKLTNLAVKHYPPRVKVELEKVFKKAKRK